MTNPPIIQTSNSITIFWDGSPCTVNAEYPGFNAVQDALREQNWELARDLMQPKKAMKQWSQGAFTLEEEGISYKGTPLPPVLAKRVMALWQDNLPYEHLLRFYERLALNPSRNSVQQLYSFLEHENLPITDDGCFLGYKGVRNDYLDYYSGTCDNTPGRTLEMPRNAVQDDPNQGCSYGYHVGSLAYASNFCRGGRLVIVKTDPYDVVSVPHDCGHQKLRTAKYVVIADYEGPLPEQLASSQAPYDDEYNREMSLREIYDDQSMLLDDDETQCRATLRRIRDEAAALTDSIANTAYGTSPEAARERLHQLGLREDNCYRDLEDIEEDRYQLAAAYAEVLTTEEKEQFEIDV